MAYLALVRSVALAAVLFLQGGPDIPPPRGLVNDFANVIAPDAAARIEQIAADIRSKTRGEIAVVTLADLGGREPSEIALRIGREWKVGNLAAIGDRSRNAGVVILIVPKETSKDKHGKCRIEVGQGAEGFITDATAGEICREAIPSFAARDYSAGIELVTTRVAQRFAQEFNVALDSGLALPDVQAPAQRRTQSSSGGINPVVLIIILFVLLSIFGRGRRGCMPLFIPFGGGFGGGGGGFGGGGGGGDSGGGFGGFGGGGGFSGGGGGSDW